MMRHRLERAILAAQEGSYKVDRGITATGYGLYRAADRVGTAIGDAGSRGAHAAMIVLDVAHGIRVGLTPREALGNARLWDEGRP